MGKACLLESLQVPKRFYLPEAVAVAGPKRGTRAGTPVAGLKGGASVADEQSGGVPSDVNDDDDDDDGGFLSFGAAGDMEVDT